MYVGAHCYRIEGLPLEEGMPIIRSAKRSSLRMILLRTSNYRRSPEVLVAAEVRLFRQLETAGRPHHVGQYSVGRSVPSVHQNSLELPYLRLVSSTEPSKDQSMASSAAICAESLSMTTRNCAVV